MMNDNTWTALRYILIAGGAYLAGRGIVPAESVGPMVDAIVNAAPALLSIATGAWGLYIGSGTKRVPIQTAQRKDVPTVNPATGQIQPGSTKVE